MADVIPGTARLRGTKLIAGAAMLSLVLRVIGFHKFFENDAEGIGALLQALRRIGHKVPVNDHPLTIPRPKCYRFRQGDER
jgi:hypothetical protein